MGGSVNVVIRLTDGSVFSGAAWTNNQPSLAHGLPDAADIDTYLNRYIRRSNTEGDNLVFYSGAGKAYPHGYGLIVYDAMSKTILSMQDYCDFTTVTSFYHWHRDSHESQLFRRHYEQGRLALQTAYFSTERNAMGHLPVLGTIRQGVEGGLTFERFTELCNGIIYGDTRIPASHSAMLIDLAPWTVEEFATTKRSAHVACLARITALGFVLSKRAEWGWTEWNKYPLKKGA